MDVLNLMVSLRRTAPGVLLAAALSACGGSPVAVRDAAGAPDVTLEFGVHHQAHIYWPGMDRLEHAVEIRDHFEVFCWPATATAEGLPDGDGVVVRLTGRPLDGCSPELAAGVSYRLNLRLADGGQPAFIRVEHRWGDRPDPVYSVIWR